MPQEGEIVRNKRTGEMAVWQGGRPVPMPGAAPAAAPSGPVFGAPPRVDVPTPIQIESNERAREDQQFQREKFVTEQRRADRLEERANAGTVDEKKIATLLTRIAGGASDIQSVAGPNPNAQAPGMIESIRGDLMPGGLGGMVTRAIAGSDRRSVHDAQRDILDAALTLGTGAAYNAEQLSGQMASYFPQYGDTQEEIALKNQRLARLIEAAKANAGPAWDQVEPAIAPFMQSLAQPRPGDAGGLTREQSIAQWGREYVTEDGRPLGPEGGYAQDKETGEWAMIGRVSDETPSPFDPGGGSNPLTREATALDEIAGRKDAVDLAGEGMMLGLGDEAAGVGTVISGALTGDFNIADNYTRGRDVDRLRTQQARDRLGWGGTAMEVLGGGALGRVQGGVSSLMQAGRTVATRGAPITRAALQGQLTRQAGTEGALAGGVGGFGYGEGAQGSTVNALIGAGTGGVIGAGGQMIGNALANRAPQVAGAQVQRAADDLSIPVIPAVTGGTTARRLTSGARQGFISDRPIAAAVGRMDDAGGGARDRVASQTGRVMDGEDAGNVVRQAANVYSRRTSQIGGRLYERADRMAGGVALPLPKAVQVADDWLAKLAKSAEGTGGQLYRDVKKLRDQLAARPLEVEGIRQTRTILREQIQERGLRGSATDKVMGEILQAAGEDLFDGLTAAGKGNAAGALRTANAFWQKRIETIDEVLEPILGKNAPRSGEQIVTALEALAKPKTGNAARLRQLFGAMPPDEARSVSATIISRMGQPTAGAAQTGSGFSFNTFLTNWNNLSPRARATMFPKESREALDRLATVAQGVKQAGGAMNTSNTAGALTAQAAISLPIVWIASPLTAVGAAGGQWMVGRLLASPRIARWIASTPRNPQARNAHIARLAGIARAEPALANEIGIFERALRQAANDNAAAVTGAAAQEPEGRQQ